MSPDRGSCCSPRTVNDSQRVRSARRRRAPFPVLLDELFGALVLDGADAIAAAEVVNNPTAIVLSRVELFAAAIRAKGSNQSQRGRYASAYPFGCHCRHRRGGHRRTCHRANGATAGTPRATHC